MPQGALLHPISDNFGCVGGKCWAGVYVDSASKEILHLAREGRAFFSPGTAAGTRRGKLWWKATEDRLRVLDSHDQPVNWPGTASDLQRDPDQAGKLAGFGMETDKTNSGHGHVEERHLVRDPLGFVFPGCSYVLSLRSKSPLMTNTGKEYRVVLNEDGTITESVGGGRIAQWSFPEAKPVVGSKGWATGDELLLVLGSNDRDVRTVNVCVDREKICVGAKVHPKLLCPRRAEHTLQAAGLTMLSMLCIGHQAPCFRCTRASELA